MIPEYFVVSCSDPTRGVTSTGHEGVTIERFSFALLRSILHRGGDRQHDKSSAPEKGAFVVAAVRAFADPRDYRPNFMIQALKVFLEEFIHSFQAHTSPREAFVQVDLLYKSDACYILRHKSPYATPSKYYIKLISKYYI